MRKKKKVEYPKCTCGGDMERTGSELVGKFVTMMSNDTGLDLKSLPKKNLDAFIGAVSCLITGPYGIWKCKKCGTTEGGYSAIGRNMISIEPLPVKG